MPFRDDQAFIDRDEKMFADEERKIKEDRFLPCDWLDHVERNEKENKMRPREMVLNDDFPRIVCLCGSTRFMDTFHSVGWQLTLDGDIVLTVGVCKHAEDHGGEALGQDVAEKLDELHKRKIDLCDVVWVLNVNGYIGESTAAEIEYAKEKLKHIVYLEPLCSEGGE